MAVACKTTDKLVLPTDYMPLHSLWILGTKMHPLCILVSPLGSFELYNPEQFQSLK